MNYSPPSPEELKSLRDELGFTQTQMAELAGVAGNSQWRKYTGGKQPRKMSVHMLFFIAAQLELSEQDIASVLERMRRIGAQLDGLPS